MAVPVITLLGDIPATACWCSYGCNGGNDGVPGLRRSGRDPQSHRRSMDFTWLIRRQTIRVWHAAPAHHRTRSSFKPGRPGIRVRTRWPRRTAMETRPKRVPGRSTPTRTHRRKSPVGHRAAFFVGRGFRSTIALTAVRLPGLRRCYTPVGLIVERCTSPSANGI